MLAPASDEYLALLVNLLHILCQTLALPAGITVTLQGSSLALVDDSLQTLVTSAGPASGSVQIASATCWRQGLPALPGRRTGHVRCCEQEAVISAVLPGNVVPPHAKKLAAK